MQSLTLHSYVQEGQANQAQANSHANDDGVIDKDEQKAIDRAHKKALESRCAGFGPQCTGKGAPS